MKKTTFNLLRAIFFMGVIGLIGGMALGFVSPAAALSFVLGGGGLNGMNIATATATQTIVDTAATTGGAATASSQLLLEGISQKITEMRRSKYPLDTILREIGLSENINSWESKWYNLDERGVEDTVHTTHTTSGAAGLRSIKVNRIDLWQKDDLCLVDGVTGTDGYDVVLMVCDVDRPNTEIDVIAINTTSNIVPTVNANTKLTNIGNAKSETAAQTNPLSILPTPTYNYMQIHMAQIEESVIMNLHKKEVPFDITDYKMAAIYHMRKRMELTSLFGVRGFTTDAVSGETKYTSGGITRQISKSIPWTKTAALSNDDLISWTESIFVGNSGADKRILFTGAGLNSALMKIPMVNKQLEAGKTEVKFGITFNLIETNYGQLLVKHHDLFNQTGSWYYNGLVLDVGNLEKHIMEPFNTKPLDLDQTGQRRVKAYRMLENFCVATRYPDTHALIIGQ